MQIYSSSKNHKLTKQKLLDMKVLCLIGTLLLLACDQIEQSSQSPQPALVMTVDSRTTMPPTTFVGDVRPRYVSAQGFRISGKIIERNVEVGDLVNKGQLLAKLDNTDTSLSLKVAQAQVRVVEADLAIMRAKLDRQRKLFERNFISEHALETHEAAFRISSAQLKQARAQAEILGNQLRYTNLLAERGGIIIEIHAEPGQVIEAGKPIVHIAVPDTKEVVISISESKMDSIAVGSPAQVSLWANPNKIYEGIVREIAPAADSTTRTFQARIALINPDDNILLGMTAEVKFSGKDSSNFFLPMPAITQREGKNIVWVVDTHSGKAQPRRVRAGLFHQDGVYVTDGLQDGELVVVAGVHTLLPGQVVRPVPVHKLP